MGALIAFEMARAMRRRHATNLAHLFVSARIAPHLVSAGSPMSQLPDIELIARLRELNGTPEMVLQHQELLNLFLPIIRADMELNETYLYYLEAPLSVPLTVFGGTSDPRVSQSNLEMWKDHASSSFSLKMFSGDHFFINTAKQQVLASLSAILMNILM